MTTASPASRRVSPGEIADLVAWARRLTETSAATDPGERAAYLAAKADVMTRIAETHATAEHATTLLRASIANPGDSQ
jgi:hypothetical protein